MKHSEAGLRPAVVLVADRTLSAQYRVLLEGMFATMQTTDVPAALMRRLISPPMPADRAGRAWAAPVGLRRVEAALLGRTSLTAAEVVCTTPESLGKLLGPWVKIVGVSSSDPLGRGMSNTTTENFQKGQLYTRTWMRQMMETIVAAKRTYDFQVVAGGAGAWQYVLDGDEAQRQGIDVVFEGYFESLGPQLFMDILSGKDVGSQVRASGTAADDIEPIRGPSLLGVVELSRGCGNGCGFCTMAGVKMAHVPAEMILADLETNVAGGINSVVSGSEDIFRYGGSGSAVNFENLHALLSRMKEIGSLSFMQIDHANLSSVLQLSLDQLREIRRLLTWGKASRYLWVNMGIESASGSLVLANSPGKMGPFGAEDWEAMVVEGAERMTAAGFFCVFSVILGLPGETPDDVERTLKLVERLADRPVAVFPIFYEPLPENGVVRQERFDLSRMRQDHLRLYTTCYEINFASVPRLLWDNQRAAGVGWSKRMLMQMLGRVEVRSWRRAFARVAKQIDEGGSGARPVRPGRSEDLAAVSQVEQTEVGNLS